MKFRTHKIKQFAIALIGSVIACIGTADNHRRATPTFVLAELTDDQVRDAIIKHSIAKYPGNCPCPYHVDRAGRQCGGRSAWSRAGGASPLCFRTDVKSEMIREWRAKNSG